MKICTKCHRELPEDCFYKDPRRENGLRSICKECWAARKKEYVATHREQVTESNRRYYLIHKEESNARSKAHQLKNREKITEQQRLKRQPFKYKLFELKTPCEKCGENRPWILEFHHINWYEKLFEVTVSAFMKFGEVKIKDEISKCICLCANCHREFHYFYGVKPTEPKESLDKYLRGDNNV